MNSCKRSLCCGAPVSVSNGEEGTNYYVCKQCGEPCDAMDDIKDLKRINNQHRLLNADLRQCIKELESELKMGNHLYAELTDKCRELEHDVFMLENKKLGLKSRVDELESELKKAKAQSDTFFEDGIRKAKRIKELEQIGHWLITVSCTCGYTAEEVYAALKGGESND